MCAGPRRSLKVARVGFDLGLVLRPRAKPKSLSGNRRTSCPAYARPVDIARLAVYKVHNGGRSVHICGRTAGPVNDPDQTTRPNLIGS